MHHPSRDGVRGGKDQFEWESIKTDKHRENYLGHSVMAPVGRWQKGKDLTWYAKDKQTKVKQQQTERNKVKQLEEEAMAAALGFGTIKKKTTALTKQEIAETLKRGQTERDSGNVERVEGMGFGSSRAAMMDSNRSNDGFIKEPEAKIQQVKADTPSKERSDDENRDERKKRKKKKKHKVKKSKDTSKKEKRENDRTRRRGSESEDGSESDTRDTSSRNKYKELKTNRKREKSRNSESEDENRSRRKDKYKELRNEPIKRKRRNDSSPSDDQYQRSKERERRTNRRHHGHDSD